MGIVERWYELEDWLLDEKRSEDFDGDGPSKVCERIYDKMARLEEKSGVVRAHYLKTNDNNYYDNNYYTKSGNFTRDLKTLVAKEIIILIEIQAIIVFESENRCIPWKEIKYWNCKNVM